MTKTYFLGSGRSVTPLRAATLRIARGEFVVITGRSGSGKTTLLNLAAGLTRPNAGRVLVDGVDWWALDDRRRSALRREKIGFVFQFPSLIPSLTALENAALPVVLQPSRDRKEAYGTAAGLLRLLGLGSKLASFPRQLSAGQQQRVVIARALFNRPEILLADEPTSDLDEESEIEIMDLFRQIHAGGGITIALVTHSSQLVRYGTRSLPWPGSVSGEPRADEDDSSSGTATPGAAGEGSGGRAAPGLPGCPR